jgi:hypothetical protein
MLISPTVFAVVPLQGISWKTCASRNIAIGCEGDLLASKMKDGRKVHLVRFRGATCPMEVEDYQISGERP